MNALFEFSRADLQRMPRAQLSKPTSFKPSVFRIETPHGAVVVKDARHAARPLRWLARWLLARERKVLVLLDSLDGVPRLLGAIDADAIAISLVPGHPLDREIFRARPREVVDQLRHLIHEMHARGVFHLDLHQRKNLLVDGDGRLRLVDFGAAMAPSPVLRLFLGGVLRYADRQAGTKYLARFAPEALSEAEAHAVVRYHRLRWLWPFSAAGRRERTSARARVVATGRRATSSLP